MNRRSFLGMLGGMVGGIAIEQAIPFNRVWSFPSKIVVPDIHRLATVYYDRKAIEILGRQLVRSTSILDGVPVNSTGERYRIYYPFGYELK